MLEDYVEEQKGAENVSYILKYDDCFFMTGYKVLQSKERKGLIECGKLRYNGRIKLVYFTVQYMSLQTMVNYLDGVSIKTVLRNLIGNILAIRENGFLKCDNIDVRPEKIFIDRNTLEVYLIYLPIKMIENEYDKNGLENELRTQLIKLLNSAVNLNGAEMRETLYELSNGSVSLEQLYHFLQMTPFRYEKTDSNVLMEPKNEVGIEGITLKSQDGKCVFYIKDEEYVIGKKPELVNGLISGNAAVSRIHCKLIRKKGEFFIMDLSSANGTYLNGERIDPNKEERVGVGDRVKIANVDFQVI